MKTVRELMGPAAIAALVLTAAGPGTPPAMADEHRQPAASTAPAVPIEEASREQAKKAHEDAAEDAARAVKADAKLELDIRLIGRSAVLIADER